MLNNMYYLEVSNNNFFLGKKFELSRVILLATNVTFTDARYLELSSRSLYCYRSRDELEIDLELTLIATGLGCVSCKSW